MSAAPALPDDVPDDARQARHWRAVAQVLAAMLRSALRDRREALAELDALRDDRSQGHHSARPSIKSRQSSEADQRSRRRRRARLQARTHARAHGDDDSGSSVDEHPGFEAMPTAAEARERELERLARELNRRRAEALRGAGGNMEAAALIADSLVDQMLSRGSEEPSRASPTASTLPPRAPPALRVSPQLSTTLSSAATAAPLPAPSTSLMMPRPPGHAEMRGRLSAGSASVAGVGAGGGELPRAAPQIHASDGVVLALSSSEPPPAESWGRSSQPVRRSLRLPQPVGLQGLLPDWEADDARPTCAVCNKSFDAWSRRRHHCRCCGVLVCDSCSRGRVTLPAGPAQRVCSLCEFDARVVDSGGHR